MARYFDVHPLNPQPRAISQTVALLRDDALIAYPTDSCYALGFELDSPTGADRIRRIRGLDDRHHFTFVCADFAQLGQFVQLDNAAFRSIKAVTPGPVHLHPDRDQGGAAPARTPEEEDGGRADPDSAVVQALVRELGKPLVSSSLLLPGDEEPMTDGWQIKEALDPWWTRSWTPGTAGPDPPRSSTGPRAPPRSSASVPVTRAGFGS
jgi:tRNA threonylcarbamoyl adenosine modification protein (Sua5/YciO/YrdC/YwlC family)